MTFLNKRNLLLLVGLFVLGGALYFVGPLDDSCRTIANAAPEPGSQGYRVWSGETLKSFDHGGRKVCVPVGWEPIGALESGDGWATFQKGKTGVVIRSDSWASLDLTPRGTSYTVSVRYPVITPAALIPRYVNIISNSFSRVGALFADTGTENRTHTVLITVGLAGNTVDDNSRIYPDPTARASMFVRTPLYPRAEELYTHAVMHLYNRFRADLTDYASEQEPYSAEDWQEAEATWAETAFSTTDVGRVARMQYLYNVHTAVRTNNIGLIEEPPFDDPIEFAKITQSVVQPEGADDIDYQYGHYVLSPLVMLATEGLLIRHKSSQHVEDILTRIHTGEVTNYLAQLGTLLPKGEVDDVRAWINGTETVPLDLVQRAVEYYGAQ